MTDTVMVVARVFVLCLALCLLADASIAQAESGPTKHMVVGQPAPPFTLSDLSGRMVTLSVHQGRPVILNFWATWCVPCRDEMPLLQQAHERHRRAGLTVLAISQDTADGVSAARTYWTQAGWVFPTLLDPDGSVARQYHVLFLPSTFFINAQGVVTAIHRGPIRAPQLKQYLSRLMAPLG